MNEPVTIWSPYRARRKRAARVPTGEVILSDDRRLVRVSGYPDAKTRAAAKRLGIESDLEGFIEGGVFLENGSRQGFRVLASLDNTPKGELLHVSCSYQDRDPNWAEIRAVRDAFFPADVDVMMVLPQAVDYVNVAEHAFHLWQTPTEWGLQ